jgi:hypothetical protein
VKCPVELARETSGPGRAGEAGEVDWRPIPRMRAERIKIFVRAFPDRGGKWQISSNGGSYPVWSRNGRELFFRNPDNRIMVIAYTVKDGSFVEDKPHLWSETRLVNTGSGAWNFDLAPDGKRLVVLLATEERSKRRRHGIV